MNKTLVAYFSASGQTAKLAKTIAEITGGALHEIKPVQPYTSSDLNWQDKNSRSSIEMQNADSRPKIENSVQNMNHYDIVYIGFPIWWYIAPTIINTFLESYDFTEKTVIPFATSGGSGMGKTVDILQKCCSSGTKWRPGKRFSNATDNKTIQNWIDSLHL